MAIDFSTKVNDIIDKKLKAMDVADARFLTGFEPIEKKIYEAVQKKVLDMNFESGKSLFDDTNVQMINELNDVITNAIKSSGYPAKVKEYLRSFDTIKQFNFDAHKDVNDLSTAELEKLVNPMQKQVVQQTIDGLTGSGIDTQFIQPMKEGIFKNIVSGATITDLESYLKSYILSDELNLGKFKKYTTQIARDTLNQFDGQVNSRIANEYGLNAFKYVGSLIDDSRPQCVRWVGKGTLLLDELQTEISWAYSNGSGMIPGTTPDNFSVYRGGYNCRHSAIPFKMTKSQIEKYNKEQKKIDEQPIENTFVADKNLNDAIIRANKNGFVVYHEGDELINKIAETEIIGENYGLSNQQKIDNIKKLFDDKEIQEFDNETKLKIINSANEFFHNNPDKKPIDLIIYDEKNQPNTARYEPNTKSIIFNSKKNITPFINEKTELIDSMNVYFAADKYENKILGIYSHEYAHFYDIHYLPREKRISMNIYAWNNNEIFFNENWKKIESLISYYGVDGYSATEFVAELWTTIWNPKFNLLPNETKIFIDDVMKTFGSYNEKSLKNWKKLRM